MTKRNGLIRRTQVPDIKNEFVKNNDAIDTLNKTEIKTESVKSNEYFTASQIVTRYDVPISAFVISTTAIGPFEWLYIGSDDPCTSASWFNNMSIQKIGTLKENDKSNISSKRTQYHFSKEPIQMKSTDEYNALNINSKVFFYKKGYGFDRMNSFRDKLVQMSYQVNYRKMSCCFSVNDNTCPSCFETECECYVRYCTSLSFATDSTRCGYIYSVVSGFDAEIQYPSGDMYITDSLTGNPLETFVKFLSFVGEDLAKKQKYNRILIT